MPSSRSKKPASKGRKVVLSHSERRVLLELARARLASLKIAPYDSSEAQSEREALLGAIRGLLAEGPRHL